MITVWEWADKHRFLDSRTSAEPGPWRTDRNPCMREPMEKLSTWDPCERVVIMSAAQVGKTETGNNWIAYIVHHAPGPMLVVQSTVELAVDWSKQRLASMIDSTEVLRDRIADARSRDSGNTLRNKEFPGGAIYIYGANAPSGLRSKPIRYLFLDEVDSYPKSAGPDGDPVKLAMVRTANFPNRKILMTSTPTIKGESRIEKAYEASDRRRYWVPCPSCEEMQILDWQRIDWPKGRPTKATYECRHCEEKIQHHHKAWMLERGEWRAEAEGDGKTCGYKVSALYSPWMSWGAIAAEWVEAQGDPALLQVVVNTLLGETWDLVDGEGVDAHRLLERRELYGPGPFLAGTGPEVPAGVVTLTAAVDVQDDRLEVEVCGWGLGEECWNIDHVILPGDPAGPDVWTELDEVLQSNYRHEYGIDMLIQATCVDTGGRHTQDVYDYCLTRLRRRVWAIKGRAGNLPIWPAKVNHTEKRKVLLHILGVDSAKEQLYARLLREDPGPGYCHFPLARGWEYFEQLTAEVRRAKHRQGMEIFYWWKPDKAANEALDLRVYNMAALHGLYAQGWSLEREERRLKRAARQDTGGQGGSPVRSEKRRDTFLKGAGKGWLKGR